MENETDIMSLVQGNKSEDSGQVRKEWQGLFVKSVDPDKMQIEAIASTPTIDRGDDIVLPEAFKDTLKEYMKNPVVLAAHQHASDSGRSMVVGHVVKAKVDKRGLHITVEFADTELGREYFELYSGKHQRAFSIGFRSIKWRDESRDGKRVHIHEEVELYEISVCPVPMNPECLSKHRQQKAAFVQDKKEEKDLAWALADSGISREEFEKDCDDFWQAILEMVDDIDIPGDNIKLHSELESEFAGARQEFKRAFGGLYSFERYWEYINSPQRKSCKYRADERELFEIIESNGLEAGIAWSRKKIAPIVSDSDNEIMNLVKR